MRRLLVWMHCLLLTVLLAPVERVAACSCAPAHPQTQFCESDFGITILHNSRILFCILFFNITDITIKYFLYKFIFILQYSNAEMYTAEILINCKDVLLLYKKLCCAYISLIYDKIKFS